MSTRNNFIYNSGKQLDISYNSLNLPRTVDNGANGKMQFVYNAAGQKLRTTLYDSPSNITDTSDYIGNFIYKNGQLSYILMPEGRILPNGSSFAYEYHLKDQLGNTRATYIAGANGNAKLTQTTADYPFGLPINVLSSNLENNPYLYNGKELHSELNLNLFDYGARFYDAEVGRFNTIDPLAEKRNSVSPYNYTQNNPILRIDPNGMLDNPIYDKKGEFLGTDDNGLQGEAIVMDKEDFTQGMAHQKAMSVGNTLDNMSWSDALKFANNGNFENFINHYNNLNIRPDWDGVVTINEGIQWAKDHPNTKNSNNPSDALYLDVSKMDFGNLSTEDFDDLHQPKMINLLYHVEYFSNNSRYTTYALGRTFMTLNSESGNVSVLNSTPNYPNGEFNAYDWNYGSWSSVKGLVRITLLLQERIRHGLNDTHGFPIKVYGTGQVNVPQPINTFNDIWNLKY